MTWSEILAAHLPLLGHRNWIVIADSAFPEQCSDGMTVLWSEGDLLSVAFEALEMIKSAPHVRPRIATDAELDALDDTLCPGVERVRSDLDRLVSAHGGRRAVPHEDLLKQLAQAGQTYSIVMVKTTMAMPYTSLFIELQCGYWGDSAEKQLRAKMAAPRH